LRQPKIGEDVVLECAHQLIFRYRQQVGLFPVQGGVVDQDIDLAECLYHFVDNLFAMWLFREVTGDDDAFAVC
jgi:hypothetical protein